MNEVTPSASVWWAPETIPPLGKVGQPYFILYESRVVAPNVLPRHEEQPLHLVQVLAVPREQPRRAVHLVEPQAVLHEPLHQRVVAVGAARRHAFELEVHPRRHEGERLCVPLRASRYTVSGRPNHAALPLSLGRAGARTAAGGQRRRMDDRTNGEAPVGGHARCLRLACIGGGWDCGALDVCGT